MTRRVLLTALLVASTAALIGVVSARRTTAVTRELDRAWRWSVSPGELSSPHGGFECTSCHQPGRGPTRSRCGPCHDAAALGRSATRFHESIGECAPCHVEHRGRDVRPIAMDHEVLARALPRGAPALAGLDCGSCHGSIDPHGGALGAECASCHALASWEIPSFLHPSQRVHECAQCHRPPPSHLMGHFQTVSQRAAHREGVAVEDCWACHTVGSWNEIVRVGWVDHH